MDLTSKKALKNIFKKYKIHPSKKLGQNFLIDKKVLQKIIKAANLSPKDIVLEIGPGVGTLTQELAKKVKKVIALEKDPRMIKILRETIKEFNNIKIVKADILKINFQFSKNYKVVANLPYNIVSPVIRKFLESRCQPREMILMVQKEVGQRISANPPKMNILAISVQFYAEPEIKFFVKKGSFWPQPKVDSAIIKITPKKPSTRPGLVDGFLEIVKAGFSQPRKQLANNLSKGLNLNKQKIKSWLTKNKISPSQRAETLSLKDWLKLTKAFKN